MQEPTEEKWFILTDKTILTARRVHCSDQHWVTECGMIYSEHVDRFLTHHLDNGYRRVSINNIKYQVHRIVAMAYCFNPDPDKNVEVDHIDGDRQNTHYKNLRWVTHSKNILSAHESGALKPHYKKVKQFDDQGNVIKIFDSFKEAAIEINPDRTKTARTNILRSIQTNGKYLGFYWKSGEDKEWQPPKKQKPISQIDNETDDVIQVFDSCDEAVKHTGINKVIIKRYITNKTVKDGFRYEYKDISEEMTNASKHKESFDLSFLKEKVEIDGKMVKMWKPIQDNEKYYVSRDARVFSTKQNKFLKQHTNIKGYVSVQITKNLERGVINLNLGRLVIKTHGPPNLENKPTVDHIDSNPSNNDISNLMWATGTEQNNRIMAKETHPNFAAIGHYNKDGTLIKKYKNIAEASRDVGVAENTIQRRLKKNIEWKRL